MKSKKPGYRAGGPTSRVRPRTPARRVAGKPTPLQTEQMRAAATLASKQAASKRRATLAQRKRMMAAKKNRPAQPTAANMAAQRKQLEIRLRADLNRARAKAAAANKQNPNLDIKPNDIKPNTGKTSAQRKKLFNAASSMAVDKFNANAKNRPTPKAKSAIHGSLEAFAAAAAASTKNRSTPKAKPVQATKVSSARMKAMKAQREAAAPTQSRPSAKPPWANKGNTGK